MSKNLLGIAIVLTAGALMAGASPSNSDLDVLPHVAYMLATDDHGGGSGGSDHGDRSGPSDRSGRSHEDGDDHGGHGEFEPGDDNGVDVNDQPDDSDILPLVVPF